MVYFEDIHGKYVVLRHVKESDAEFILKLRTNKKYNKYLNATSDDINLQYSWISNQQKREGDYYFVIMNSLGQSVGLISLYDICVNKQTAYCGRWISEGNAFENLEAVKLIHEFGFYKLGLKSVYTQTVKENISVVSFWKRFGGYFDGYIYIEPFVLHRNVVEEETYSKEIVTRISKLLYKK